MDRNKFNSDKYYIYTIQEYFKNEYMRIENRKLQSIRQQLLEFLELTELINMGGSNTIKFKNSRKALMESILFYFDNSLIIKNKELTRDIELIKGILKDNENERKLELCISSLYKKIRNLDIIVALINIQIEEIKSFEDCDINLECIISELLYEGYTLEYLNTWYGEKEINKKIQEAKNEDDTKEILTQFKELADISKNRFDIILNLMLPQVIKEEIIKEKSLEITKIKYELLEDYEINDRLENIKIAKGSLFVKVSINACDRGSAINIVVKNIENYMNLYTILETNLGSIIRKCLIEVNNELKEIKLDGTQKYKHKLNYRGKEDIQDFLNLRDEFRKGGNKLQVVDEIERAINVVQKNPNDTLDNILLNLWGVLENILINQEGGSIIEKVYQIVPKVIVMYSVKREMNHLWDRIYTLLSKEKIIVDGLDDCIILGSNKYKKHVFSEFLLREESGMKLFKATATNIGTSRQVANLNKLLKDPKALKKKMIFEEQAIRHNISSIYRLRNNIAHTGKNGDVNLESNIVVLNYYINCILGSLIHHVRRNPYLTTNEILNSISLTYNEYLENINILVSKVENINKKSKEEIRGCEKSKVRRIEKETIEKIEKEIIDYGIDKIAYAKYLYI